MRVRITVAAVLATGCWTGTPPSRTVDAPPPVRACKIYGRGGTSAANVSAVAGDAPYLVGFELERAAVEVGLGEGGDAWLPAELRWEELGLRGFVRGRELELYLRAPRMLAGAVLVGSGHRLVLARGHGDRVDVELGLPPAVRVVDPHALPSSFACAELAAFGAPYVDARDELGLHVGDAPQQFAVAQVAVAIAPGGRDVVTLDTQDRIAYVIEQRAGFSRVWVPLDEELDVAVVGWVPASSIAPARAQGDLSGWGTIGTGRAVPLWRCADKTAVSLVRAGRPERVVGELAAGAVVSLAPDPEAPAGTLALQRYTIDKLHLADGARLVVDAAACVAQNRRPSSGP